MKYRFVFALIILVFVSTVSAAETRWAGTLPDDLVSRWMELATAHRAVLFDRTRKTARTNSMVALAMFEAANSVEQRYPSYLKLPPAQRPANVRFAVAVAAKTVLADLYPKEAERFEKLLRATTEEDPDSEQDQHASSMGERAAYAALKRGQRLTSGELVPFRRLAQPGQYIVGDVPSLIADFDLKLMPWALARADSVRCEPPPPLDSDVYASDLIEVAQLGSKNGSARGAQQTETARFWFLIDFNPVLREIASTAGTTYADVARLYAMFYIAADEAWLAAGEAKAHYQFWRPVTAIRNADRDGNSKTERDPYWAPLMPTPAHPEYPCAHCVQAAAQAVILEAQLADPDRSFSLYSSALPDAEPRQISLADYVEQTSLSRIYAGAHYRFSNVAGEAMGVRIGEQVLAAFSE
ncbi:MAG: vanadium-dependent haloperoxidase [Pseudomonadota bacterium]